MPVNDADVEFLVAWEKLNMNLEIIGGYLYSIQDSLASINALIAANLKEEDMEAL